MDRMTDEQAAQLLDHMDRLTTQLSVAEDQVGKTRRLTRLLAGAIVLLMLALVGVGFTIKQNRDNSVTACESGNNRVEGQREWFHEYFTVADASAAAQGFKESSPVRVYYAEMEAWTLAETLPFRDCENLDEPIPSPGPPPSYEEALKEALKQERQKAND